MPDLGCFPELARAPVRIVDETLTEENRVLFFGEPGIGKSFFAAQLARTLADRGRPCRCICADPGTPEFGVPGAIGLAEWRGNGWHLLRLEALCTLDAGRFRTPLILALQRLLRHTPEGVLFIDAPGVARGIAGSELLSALIESARIDTVLALTRGGNMPPFASELRFSKQRIFTVTASVEARRPAKGQRDRRRTEVWDAYLADAIEHTFNLSALSVVGTPPPVHATAAWQGRQIALLDSCGETLVLGEVTHSRREAVRILAPPVADSVRALLVRDAQRRENGVLCTARPFVATGIDDTPPPDVISPPAGIQRQKSGPVIRFGNAFAVLVNGVFDDPLLHVRIRQQKRSLLFDLGDSGRLPTRIAHQISDVFITHAHIDHIGGFLWLLRARMGDFPPCRVFGPPGLAKHLDNFIGGILWDRIGDTGPRFEVGELHGDRLLRFALQVGRPGPDPLPDRSAEKGIIVDEPTFRVTAVTLDHGTAVLAYALETPRAIKIRKERLVELALPAGPWLTELKRAILVGDLDAHIDLPDRSRKPARMFAEQLAFAVPANKLVYATDFADTVENRVRLVALAEDADALFCEASFREADADQAARTGHLTTRACGELAAAANVVQLVPFHFSRRYAKNPQQVYEEIAAVCSRIVVAGPGAFY